MCTRVLSNLLAVVLLLGTSAPASGQERPVALTDVSIVDVEEGRTRSGRTVVIRDGRISRIGPMADVTVPDGARIVDGSGQFLMPGLWDVHVHAYGYPREPERIGRIGLAYGVTGIRDMGSTLEVFDALKEWRRTTRPGSAPRPRIHAAGVIVDGEPPTRPHYITAVNAVEGRGAVDSLEEMGADFIKVYGRLPAEAFRSIAEEAKRRGLEFSGHWPKDVGPGAASDAGLTTLEHADDLVTAVSSGELPPRSAHDSGLQYALARLRAFTGYDPRKAQILIERLADNGTLVVPTLQSAYTSLFGAADDVRLQTVNRLLPESQRVDESPPLAAVVAESPEAYEQAYDNLERFVTEMNDGGVVLMAGSHAPAPLIAPGLGLHQELERLSEAGLGPAEALRTATLYAANYLGRLHELGTVEEGKLADLVLLDENPLEAIRNTRSIAAVLIEGRLLDRALLDALLESAGGEGGT